MALPSANTHSSHTFRAEGRREGWGGAERGRWQGYDGWAAEQTGMVGKIAMSVHPYRLPPSPQDPNPPPTSGSGCSTTSGTGPEGCGLPPRLGSGASGGGAGAAGAGDAAGAGAPPAAVAVLGVEAPTVAPAGAAGAGGGGTAGGAEAGAAGAGLATGAGASQPRYVASHLRGGLAGEDPAPPPAAPDPVSAGGSATTSMRSRYQGPAGRARGGEWWGRWRGVRGRLGGLLGPERAHWAMHRGRWARAVKQPVP